ncbi:aldose epimerase [Pseudoroseomonas deserti]|uniref:Aldose epimerase n=1 Tax=Teichococcus deserti TaxID=1817963 RepID=A0A1V2HAM3_9PROT|nr:aldose 1-epimerase family protein [Pseudoroseomonas deserti]ONG59121.1 aldose epimerase [Pseudoroseomonas deserti]
MPDSTITLRRDGAQLDIATLGAEPRRWRVGDQDLLWHGDAAYWPKISPVLFPVVGWCRDAQIRHRGRAYPMGVHGFAAQSSFSFVAQAEDRVTLRLQDDAASRRQFPFAFALELRYRLRPSGFSARFTIRNPGDEALPYALGLHPGFLTDFDPASARLRFPAEETPEVPVIAPGGLISEQRRPVPLAGGTLPVTRALLANEAVCFLDLASRSLRFDNGPRGTISLRMQDMPHLALWSPPGAAFVCLESWTGHGDPVGFAGDITEKPSMRLLPPGGAARHLVSFGFRPG